MNMAREKYNILLSATTKTRASLKIAKLYTR